MFSQSTPYCRFAALCLSILVMQVGCFQNRTGNLGGNYPAVTAADVDGIESTHRTGMHNFDFRWTFTSDQFLIEGPDIPTDLIIDLVGKPQGEEYESEITQINGAWHLFDDNICLSIGDGEEEREVKLPIFFTGPLRIQSSEAQYVF